MAYRAQEVAETIIDLSRKRGIVDITNLKLQKLLYYSQAWHLALKDVPLFSDAMEAWVHGPVVPAVFRVFKEYRWKPIDCFVAPIEGNSSVLRHIDATLDSYGSYEATQLERLTHREDPWLNARKGVPRDEPSHNIISMDDMKLYYRRFIHA